MKTYAAIALVLLVGCFATASIAEQMPGNRGGMTVAAGPMDSLKAASGGKQLKCSSAGQKHTCTSSYAFVCPSGWRACPLTGGAKTCCTNQ